jgi:hypothetical protein
VAEPSSKGPTAAWQDLVAQWEKNLNALANRTMGSDEFSKAINQAMGLSAGMQSSLGEVMGRYLASLNLPGRAEMTSVGERLQAIEERLDRIHALLQHSANVVEPDAASASAKPPRTKRPPGRGGKP